MFSTISLLTLSLKANMFYMQNLSILLYFGMSKGAGYHISFYSRKRFYDRITTIRW